MNFALISFFTVFLISLPGLHVLPATQNNRGRAVSITAIAPIRSGPRTSFTLVSGIWDQLRIVVRDRDAWLDVWNRIHRHAPDRGPHPEPPPLPEIDFSREMIVVAAMGARPSSGYGITIDAAYERNVQLEILVRSVENPGCLAYAIMTAPVDIVRLPKTKHSVVFREIEVVRECNSSPH